jgi:cobalt-zinc-cadmium efflux system membrane fusion protein
MKTWLSLALVVGLLVLAGCGTTPTSSSTTPKDNVAKDGGTKHAGWWCDEHGVPEEECALCDPKLVADFKAQGDWCRDHERPDSQCFVCHPEREQEFAARYEAKYGKQPPKPQS